LEPIDASGTQQQLGALTGEGEGGGRTETARGAGDENPSVCQGSIHT
jgi:hypothetical protein